MYLSVASPVTSGVRWLLHVSEKVSNLQTNVGFVVFFSLRCRICKVYQLVTLTPRYVQLFVDLSVVGNPNMSRQLLSRAYAKRTMYQRLSLGVRICKFATHSDVNYSISQRPISIFSRHANLSLS